eukprot:scaffold2813_cov114-Cylindrotheca_fusiformis.AAC.4
MQNMGLQSTFAVQWEFHLGGDPNNSWNYFDSGSKQKAISALFVKHHHQESFSSFLDLMYASRSQNCVHTGTTQNAGTT